jgi:hypothetical protein
MKVRTTIILAVLVGLVGWYFVWSERQPKPETGNPKLVPFDEKAMEEVIIARDGTTIALRREGDAWRMTQPVDAKTDRGPVATLVSSLALARIERTVEEKAANLAEFGLDPPAMTITVKAKDKPQPVTLHLGKNSPTGSWVYAKTGDSPAVLLLSANVKGDLSRTPRDLRDKTVVAFDLNKTTRFELRSKDSTIVAAKVGEEWWLEQPITAKADSFAIDRLVGSVRDLKAKEFVAEDAADLAGYGLNRPDYRLTVAEKDAATPKTILIAAKAGKAQKLLKDAKASPAVSERGEAYVVVEGGKQVFLVEGKVLEDLKKSPMDLRDKRLLAFEVKDVKGIRVVWPEVVIVLEKDGDNWTLREPQAAPAENGKALDLLHGVSGFRFKEIATEKPGDLAKYGLAKPQVRVIIKKTDNTELPALEFGNVDKDKNQLFARVKNSPTVYVLESRALDDLPRDPANLKKEAPNEKKN